MCLLLLIHSSFSGAWGSHGAGIMYKCLLWATCFSEMSCFNITGVRPGRYMIIDRALFIIFKALEVELRWSAKTKKVALFCIFTKTVNIVSIMGYNKHFYFQYILWKKCGLLALLAHIICKRLGVLAANIKCALFTNRISHFRPVILRCDK